MSSEASKQSILKAAINAFSKKGFDATSIRDVAQDAKVNHAIIRYHYGSKEDLWLAVFQYLLMETANLRMTTPFKRDAPDLKAELTKFIRSRVEHIAHHPQLLKIVLLESSMVALDLKQIDTLMRGFFSETTKIIADMQEAGVTRDFNGKDLFYIMPMLIGGRFIYSNADQDFDGNPIAMDDAIDAHTDAIMKMIYQGA